jgi:hypothetical protein
VLTSWNITFEIKNLDDYVPSKPNDASQLEGEQENNKEHKKHQSTEEPAEEGGNGPENPSNINPPSQTPSKSVKQSNNPPPNRKCLPELANINPMNNFDYYTPRITYHPPGQTHGSTTYLPTKTEHLYCSKRNCRV